MASNMDEFFYGTLPQDTQDFSQVLRGVGRSIQDIGRGVSYYPYDLLGSGVDVANMGLSAIGLGSERPVLGSDYLRNIAQSLGLAQPSTGSGTETAARFASALINPAAGARAVGRAGSEINRLVSMIDETPPRGSVQIRGDVPPAFAGDLVRQAEPQAVTPKTLPGQQSMAIESSNFKNWFGDWQSDPQNASKIVDNQGLPLPVYHGSGSADIKEFDLANFEKVQKGDWGRGVYFSPSKWMADSYRKTAVKSFNKTVQEAFDAEEKLAMSFGTRPMHKWLDLQAGKISQGQYDKLTEAEQAWRDAIKKVDESDEGKVYDAYLNIKNPYNYTYGGIVEPDLALQAKRAGHDGLIIRNDSGEIEEIVAFDPKQIKSASKNTGEFSSETANIFRGAIPIAGAGILGAGMYQDEQMY